MRGTNDGSEVTTWGGQMTEVIGNEWKQRKIKLTNSTEYADD